jgi:hypothetical protein
LRTFLEAQLLHAYERNPFLEGNRTKKAVDRKELCPAAVSEKLAAENWSERRDSNPSGIRGQFPAKLA